jgi:transposase
MAQRDLRRVRRRAETVERARLELRDAIVVAHRSGESFRDIAPFAGMSHSRVYELLREAQRLEG